MHAIHIHRIGVGLIQKFGLTKVHEIRDLLWDGIPYRGASWLRDAPIEATWTRVILVPAFGGVVVAALNLLRRHFETETPSASMSAFLKAIAASVTLGTGNSLGPEGPSVEIGTSIAKGIGSTSFFDKSSGRMLSLLASGSAAGLSAGNVLYCVYIHTYIHVHVLVTLLLPNS